MRSILPPVYSKKVELTYAVASHRNQNLKRPWAEAKENLRGLNQNSSPTGGEKDPWENFSCI